MTMRMTLGELQTLGENSRMTPAQAEAFALFMRAAFPSAVPPYADEWAARFAEGRAWAKADAGVRRTMRDRAAAGGADEELARLGGMPAA